MARPKKAAGPDQPANFSGVQKLWDAISFDDWLAFLADAKPSSRFHRAKSHIKGCCPFHEGDDTPSFMVSPSKGLVKCFGGVCGRVYTNPVRFVAAILDANYGDALLELRKRFGLKGIVPESLIKHYQDYYLYQQYKRALCKAMRDFLVDAVHDPTNEAYVYARPLVDWLINTRGIHPDSIGSLGIGIIPPVLYLAKALGGNETPEYQWAREYLSAVYESGTAWLGSLAFFMYDEPDNIARIKLRKPGSKDIRWVEDRYDDAQGKFRGFYGLHYYADFLGRGETGEDTTVAAKSVYITEGEFDAMSAIDRQIRSGNIDAIWLSLGGKGAQLNQLSGLGGLDRLIALGIETIYIVRDRDDGGYGFVQHLLKQVSSNDVNIRIMVWPGFAGEEHLDDDNRIKDPDEWIRSRGYEDYSRYARNSVHYQAPHVWAFDNVADELERIPPDDLRRRTTTIVDWGKFLKHRVECDAYCRRVGSVFNMDAQVLNREINARDEDEDGFIARIMDVLREHFHFVGVEGIEGHRRRMELWHKATRTTVHVVINDEKSVETALSSFFGSLPDFIRDYIGDASFLAADGENSKISILKLTEYYRKYANIALLKSSKGLSDLRSTLRKAQGVHFVGQNDKDGFLAYMVNGRDVFRLRFPNRMEVQLLDGPRDGDTLFRVDPNRTWLHTVKTPEDILKGYQVDLKRLHQDVLRAVSIGWAWKYPLLDAQFLAAYLCCLPVMTIFSRQTSIMVNGEHQSGKSRFTGGLIGGREYPRIQFIAASNVLEGYTAASIRQDMDGCSLVLCLSEFEDYGVGDKKTITVNNVLEQARDMLSENGVRVTLGTISGNPRTYHLKHPMVCCAIRPLRNAADASRFVTFELPKEGERKDPVIVLLDEFGQARIDQIRHELAVGFLPHLPALWQANRDIEQEYSTGVSLPAKVPSRFREALHPVLAMMKFLELDYKKFAYDFCNERKDQLSRIATTSENEQIFETILSSPVSIKTDDERVSGRTTVRAMLANERDKIQEMNMTRCGVYFDNETGWLVVHWIEAMQGVLSHSRYAREASPSFLKDVSQRSPQHVAVESVTQQRVIDRVKHWTGPGISLAHISVFDVRALLDDARATVVPAGTKTTPTKPETAKPVQSAAAAGGIPDPAEEGKVQGDDDMKV